MVVAIPLQILLGLFLLFLLIYILYSALIVHQLLRFAVMGPAMPLVLTLFVLGFIFLLSASVVLLATYDWTVVVPLSSLLEPNASLFPL